MANLANVIPFIPNLNFNDAAPYSYINVDPGDIEFYLDFLFGHCEPGEGRYISLRSYPEAPGVSGKPHTPPVALDAPDLKESVTAFCTAARVKGYSAFVVPAVVTSGSTAKKDDVAEFTTLLLDLDECDVDVALDRARQVVGEPSLVARSGGINDLGQQKLHVYWRLTEPTTDVNRVVRLRTALAAAVGADMKVAKNAAQPIRILGSVHLKSGDPSAVEIVTVNPRLEYELDDLAERIEVLAPRPANGNLSHLNLDFNDASPRTDSVEVFDRVTRAGGVDGITRYDDMTAAIGYAIATYRAGAVSLDFAQDMVRTKNSRLVPPWPEDRLAREWDALFRKDMAEKGPVVTPEFFAEDDEDDEPFCFADLAGKTAPPREWLVENFITPGTTTALFGEGGIGKSMLALHMGLCMTQGKPFMGIRTKKARVFGVFCEDDKHELHRRMERMCAYEGINIADTRDMKVWSRDGKSNFLTDEKGRATEFYGKLWAKLERFQGEDQSPMLVIIDTAAHVFGGNEIVRREVTDFVANYLGRIAKRFGAVLLLAHPSKSGIITGSGDSGSTGWNGSVRSRAYLHHTDDKRNVVLDFKKANYGKKQEPIILDMKGGVFHFVRQGEMTADDVVGAVMDAMRAHEANREGEGWVALSNKDRSPKNVWTILSRRPELEGIDKNTIRKAYEIALDRGLCEIVPIEGARPEGQTEEVVPV